MARRLPPLNSLRAFEAAGRHLSFTKAAIDSISNSVAELRAMTAHSELTARLAPSFAAKWLSPRLEGFRQLHPQIELSLTHSNEVVDFERQPIDIAVTYGKGDWPGSVAERVKSQYRVGAHTSCPADDG